MFLQFYRVVFQDSVLWVTADFEISQISSEDNNGQISFFVRISFLRDFTLELVFISQKQKKESKFCSFKFDPVFSVQLSRFSWFFAITTSQVQKNQKKRKGQFWKFETFSLPRGFSDNKNHVGNQRRSPVCAWFNTIWFHEHTKKMLIMTWWKNI